MYIAEVPQSQRCSMALLFYCGKKIGGRMSWLQMKVILPRRLQVPSGSNANECSGYLGV